MTKEKQINFTGKDKKEYLTALKKIEKFVMKDSDEDLYRFVFISVDGAGKTEHNISDGGSFGRGFDPIKLIEEARNLLEEVNDFQRFYVSALTKKYLK